MTHRIDEFNHDNIQGPDADIEISLKEYGFAWVEGEEDYLFYYGIKHENSDYTRFDFGTFPKDLDVVKEFSWMDESDRDSFAQAYGYENWEEYWEEQHPFSLPNIIYDLTSYWGYENIFGSTYWAGLEYIEIFTKDTVKCELCGNTVDAKTAHLHNGQYIGDDCCWDERLKATE